MKLQFLDKKKIVSCLYITLKNFSVVGFDGKIPLALTLDIRDYQKPGLKTSCSKLAFPEISSSPGMKKKKKSNNNNKKS